MRNCILGRYCVLLTIAAVACASCSSSDDRLPVYPVKGTVVYQGKPAAGALITFHAIGAEHPRALQPNGKVQEDGSLEITTYEAGDGAPVGTYAVTVFWPEPPTNPTEAPDSGPDRFAGRYLDPQKSAWKIDIVEGVNTLPPIDLK